MTPSSRIRPQNDKPADADGDYLLYWMVAARRTRYNFGLQRAAELALEYRKPLLILEPLRVDYPDACARFHTFVIDGMRDNAAAVGRHKAVAYYPYVEPSPGDGRGLLDAFAARSVAIVTDWFPAFFIPRMIAAAARRCRVRLEAIDGNGLIPVAEHGRAFPTARGYRAFMQRSLRKSLSEFPVENPLEALRGEAPTVAGAIRKRWPAADLASSGELVRALPIDHSIPAVSYRGGGRAALARLREFVSRKLARYGDEHNDPDADCTSRLSPYLHFGHIAAHEIFSEVMTHERWTTRKLKAARAGAREGWWGVSNTAEHFLDQLTVWRELAFNGCAWIPEYHSFDTLPAWARATLLDHRGDERPRVYPLEQLESAMTDDAVWNAAQRQLRDEGWFHGYMRMLWGKKILEWSREPGEALLTMETLMNRYSLDGRDPVSYLNYGWVLGRYDRPWPERPVFGTVRAMTSESARRKLKMKRWLEEFGG